MRSPETLARRSRKHSRYLNNSDVNVVSDAAYACACNRSRSYAMQRIKDPPRAKRHTQPKLPLAQAVAQHSSDDVIPLHDHAASKDADKFLCVAALLAAGLLTLAQRGLVTGLARVIRLTRMPKPVRAVSSSTPLIPQSNRDLKKQPPTDEECISGRDGNDQINCATLRWRNLHDGETNAYSEHGIK